MPATPFLLPGVGAQGGRVAGARARRSRLAAPAVSCLRRAGSSRAHEQSGGDPASAARAEAARLRELAWNLAA